MSFDALATALDGAFECVAFDSPGFGMSDPVPSGSTFAAYGDAIFEAIAGLSLGRCHVFGHHTGAGVAIQLAHDHPESVDRLCLSGPPLLADPVRNRLGAAARPVVVEADGRHLLALWNRHRFYAPNGPDWLVHRETVQNLLAPHAHETYSVVLTTDFVKMLERIKARTLVTAGAGDTLIDGISRAHAALADSEMAVIEGAGIHLLDDAPDALAALLVKFLLA